MSSTVIGSGQPNQTITPSYSPLGKPAAGLESVESKDQTLPTVEEANASEKKRNQLRQKVEGFSKRDNDQTENGQRENGPRQNGKSENGERENDTERNRQAPDELTEAEQQQARERAVIDAFHRTVLQSSDQVKADGAAAVNTFQSNSGETQFKSAQTPTPGSLFDQHS